MGYRDKRSFDFEFSSKWVCKAKERSTSEHCYDRICQNGDCIVNYRQQNLPFGTCKCDPGWTGRLCNECCDLPCKNGGTCMIDSESGLPFCNCATAENMRYTGTLCEDYRNSQKSQVKARSTEFVSASSKDKLPEWEIPVVAATSASLLVLLSVFAILFVLYRKRNPRLMRCLGKNAPQYLDEGDERFDSFVSCDIRDGIIKKDFVPYKDPSITGGNTDNFSHSSIHRETDKEYATTQPITNTTIQESKWNVIDLHPPPLITNELKEERKTCSKNIPSN